MIRKRGSKYCVFSSDGKQIACHPTRAEAVAQLQAIEASKARRKKKAKRKSK